MLCIAQQNRSIGVNVVSKGSPSRILNVLLISLGMTILPKSSTRRTIPVAFIYLSPFLVAPLGPFAEGAGTAQAVAGGVSHRTYDTPSVICSANATSLKEGGKAAYNYFTNYAVSICKSQEIIPQQTKMNRHFLLERIGSSFLKFFTGDQIIDRNVIVFRHRNQQRKGRLSFTVFVIG